MYRRTTQGKTEFNDGSAITLIYDHAEWHLSRGQYIINPLAFGFGSALYAAEDWVEYTPPAPDPVETARAAKLAGLEAYDSSPAVNSFTLGSRSMWIAPAERTNYLNTIQGAQRLGVESIPFMGVTIPVASAIQMLDAINLYAMQCVGVTDAHRSAINALSTVEAIEGYDYTTGYPAKLHFEI